MRVFRSLRSSLTFRRHHGRALLIAVAGGCFAISAVTACGGSNGDQSEVGVDSGGGKVQDSGQASPVDSGAITDSGSPTDAPDDSGNNPWPDCTSMTATATALTIPQIWSTEDTATPKETWVTGAYVTAISAGGCNAGYACQIFLQDALTYASLGAGAHHGIKMFISSSASTHLTGTKVGDQVNALGWGWRYDVGGQHEILLEVNVAQRGCTHATGSGTATAITGVDLSMLTVDAYENSVGPLLVEVANVSGKYTGVPTQTFGLYDTAFEGGFPDAGPDGGVDIVSLSPYFLPASKFTTFTSTATTNFATIAGVFGLFLGVNDGAVPTKFPELYPRTNADIVTK